MLSLIIKVIRTTPSFKMKDIIHILLGLEAIKSHQSLNILHVLVIYGLTVSDILYIHIRIYVVYCVFLSFDVLTNVNSLNDVMNRKCAFFYL